jgi:tripartite-type tricarboxylate transporter receptor subunit TctC
MSLLQFAAVGIAAGLAAAGAQAQTYPLKSIRVVVPFAAGSATDTVGRSYTAKFNELIAGQVMMFTADLAVTMPQVKAGKIRGLAVTSLKRTSLIDLPTVEEAGGLKGYELIAWFAAYGPRGTPQAVIERLNTALNTAANSKDVKDRLIAFGVETSPHTPAQLAERTRTETVKWAKAIKDAGIQPE